MKNILFFLLGLALVIVPAFADATPVSWDKVGSILRPLKSSWSDQVQVPSIRATSTAINRFPNLTATTSTTTNLTVTSLTSALVQTGANGRTAEYAGTTCTNQFVRVLSALGVATCETVDVSADTNLAVSSPITLTGDTVGINQSLLSITESQISDLGTYLTGNETITLSGDISGSGATSITTAIGSNKITEPMLLANSATAGYVLQASSTASGGFAWIATSSLGIISGGTPGGSDTQIQFNDGGSFGGAGLTWNDTTNIMTVPAGVNGAGIRYQADASTVYIIAAEDQTITDTKGNDIEMFGGTGNGTGDGGTAVLYGGDGGADGGSGAGGYLAGGRGYGYGDGGSFNLDGGDTDLGNGGTINVNGGSTGEGSGGSILFQGGSGDPGGDIYMQAGTGSANDLSANGGNFYIVSGGVGGGITGNPGKVFFQSNTLSSTYAALDTSLLTSTDKTFTFPNLSGILALTSGAQVLDWGGATSLEIPNGSAPTVDATGEIALDTTSNQLKIYNGSSVGVYGNGNIYPAFTITATTTTFTGTTTYAIGTAYVAETWNGIQCFTNTGTVKVRVGDGTNWTNVAAVSTTVGTVTLSSNNTFTAQEKRYVQIGTPASSPVTASCTVSKSLTAD